MSKGFELLTHLSYPGRIIILGKTGKRNRVMAVYAITGRSVSSQARKLDVEKDTVWVRPTDRNLLEKGNVDLLIYPSLFFLSQGLAVSNGKQTVDIMACLGQGESASEILAFALKNWDYEPDAPVFTPRISGCILPNTSSALCVIRKARDSSSLKSVYEFSPAAGRGKMIMTYQGENADSLLSFQGEPLDIEISGYSAEDIAQNIWETLKPKKGKQDFRVALACVTCGDFGSENYDIHIINKSERDKD